jgi:distribution and morphology protein 31
MILLLLLLFLDRSAASRMSSASTSVTAAAHAARKWLSEQGFWVLPKPSLIWRRMTLDHVAAMFSWVVAGNALFLLIGTTTFVSLVLAVANTLKGQGLRFLN